MKCFCFIITNFEEYLKKNSKDKIDYSIQLKTKLLDKFANVVFPTHIIGVVYVKLWKNQNREEFFKPINFPFALLEPVDLIDEDLVEAEYVLSEKDLESISKNVYPNEKDFLKKTADITIYKHENGTITAYGLAFNIKTLKYILNSNDTYKPNLKMNYSQAIKSNPTGVNNERMETNSYASNSNQKMELNEYNYKNVKILIYTKSIIDINLEAITNSLDKDINFNGLGLAGLLLKKYGNKIEEKSKKKAKSLGSIAECMCFEVETDEKCPKYILNVISPKYDMNARDKFGSDLFITFINLFELANYLKLKQIGMPLLCTGNYGAPKSICSKILASSIEAYIGSNESTTLQEIHLVNIDLDTTWCLNEEIELMLLGSKMKIKNEIKPNEQENTASKIISTNDIKLVKDKIKFINCQMCRQRIKDWIELKSCDHKICTTCLIDLKYNNMRCIVDECIEKAKKAKKAYIEEEIYSQTCGICEEDTLKEDFFRFRNCEHKVCKICYKKLVQRDSKCPFCQKWFDKPIGNQPKNGIMKDRVIDLHLKGFEKYKTIEIIYEFPNGIQELNHPTPGKPYDGIQRKAYLPDNDQGKKVLKLLRAAFDQGLLFTIGDSITTTASGVITWNDIHHKTSPYGEYGYPDPHYLDRVISELKAKCIE